MRITRTIVGLSLLTVLTLPALPAAATAGPATHHGPGVIVWTSRAADGSEHLMIADPDGTHQRALTPAAAGVVDINAQVSPTGEWIAYEHGFADAAEIRLVRPDGGGDHRLDVPCDDPCAALVAPTWLTSHTLAYSAVNGPFTEFAASVVLWTAKLNGQHVRRLSPARSEGVFEDDSARLAGDGSYLVLRRLRLSDGAGALFRMNRNGAGLQRLTPWRLKAEVYDLSTASHGPTADLIVFESYGRGTSESTFVDLATVPATCSSPRACRRQLEWLTDNRATGRRNANPQWSPDGRSLVFTDRPSVADPNADIWTMRYGAHHRTQVSTYTGFDYRPAWG